MFVSHDREKLLNALVYFIQKTKHAHTLKLFKLLNFLDFEHFRQTGRTVTGLDYAAFKNGPVPRSLWEELQRGGDADLRKTIALWSEKDEITDAVLRRVFKPRGAFDAKYFTKRELKIMERLAFFFDETKAEDMTEFSLCALHLNPREKPSKPAAITLLVTILFLAGRAIFSKKIHGCFLRSLRSFPLRRCSKKNLMESFKFAAPLETKSPMRCVIA